MMSADSLFYSILLMRTWIKTWTLETSLVVQWLRLRIPSAGNLGSIPGQGIGSHVLQLRPSCYKQ